MKKLILAAAAEGNITLEDIEDGADFESVADWLDYAAECDIEDLVIRFGLAADTAPDIYEMNEAAARERARFASIKGA